MHAAPWFRAPLLFVCVTHFACGSDPIEAGLPKRPATNADAGIDPDPEPAAECPLALRGETRASAGGRLTLSLEADPSAELELELPEGWRGTVEDGIAIVRIPNTSTGERTVRAFARCADSDGSAELTVSVEAPRWVEIGSWVPGIGTHPGVRQLSSLIVDPEDSAGILMYGGASPERQGYVQELWSLDLERDKWSMVGDFGSPEIYGGEAVVAIEGERAFLATDALSGWEGSGTDFSLYRMDYGGESPQLTSLAIQDGPSSGSFGGALVYVPHLDRYLLACGLGEQGAHCDVGLYDLNSGRYERPTIEGERPSGRYGFAYGYDEETKRLVIFSGGQDATSTDSVNPASDTWVLDVSDKTFRWSKLELDNPVGRRNSSFALDPEGHRLFVWGGTPNAQDVSEGLFVLDLDPGFESWQRLDLPNPPPTRSSGAGTFDRAGHRAIFGFGNTRSEVFVDLQALQL